MSSYTWCAGILLLLVSSTLSARNVADCECGLQQNAQYRIANGERANPNEFPWLVTIKFMGDLFCGGAIINDLYVLTAGHCVQWNAQESLSVVIGQHSRVKKDGQEIPVLKKIVHQDFYSHSTHDDIDIALVKLKRRIRFSPKVSPICLPRASGSFYGNARASVAGWGAKSETDIDTNILRKTMMTVLTDDECRRTTMGRYVNDLVFCAYGHNSDVCKGDSGGPLAYEKEPGKYEIIGLVSFGKDCGKLGSPGIYTKISKYVDWIRENARDGNWCRDD